MKIIDDLRPLLQTAFQRELFGGATMSVQAVENPLRLNNFSTAFRELVRDVLDHLAPNEEIKRCSWYVPDLTSGNGVTSGHRVSFVIHGGIKPTYAEEELYIDVQGERKQLIRACPQLLSIKPDSSRGELNGSKKVARGFIVAGGDSPELLELAKEICNQMPRFV